MSSSASVQKDAATTAALLPIGAAYVGAPGDLLENEGFTSKPNGFPSVFNPATRTAGGDLHTVQPDTSGKTLKKKPFGIYYEVHGKGPIKIVFLMGLANSCAGWLPQIEYFSNPKNGNTDKYSTLVYDQRGYGCSQVPSGRYRTSDMGHDVLSLLKELKWTEQPGQVHLVGVSMGGMITLELAKIAPELWGSITLISTTSGQGLGEKELAVGLPPLRGVSVIAQVIGTTMFGIGDQKARVTNVLELLFPDVWLSEKHPEDPKGRTRREVMYDVFVWRFKYSRRAPPSGILSQIAAVTTHRVTNAQLAKINADISAISIVTGDEDHLVNPGNSIHLAKNMPKARLVQMKQSGHALPLQRVDQITMADNAQIAGSYAHNLATGVAVLGAYTSLLFITLIFLVLMSTPLSRRRPIFWFQAVSAVMLIVSRIAIIQVAITFLRAIVESVSFDLRKSALLVVLEITAWVPLMLLDATLVLKAMAFFPTTRAMYRPIGPLSRFLPVAIPVICLIVRIPNYVAWLPCAAQTTTAPKCERLQPIDNLLQIIGNGYATGVILLETHRLRKSSVPGNVIRSSDLILRLKLLVEATLLSFLPVVVLQVILCVFVFRFPHNLNIKVALGLEGNTSDRLMGSDNIAFAYLHLANANFVGSCVFSVIATSYQPIRILAAKRDRAPSTPGDSGEGRTFQPSRIGSSAWGSSRQPASVDPSTDHSEPVPRRNKSLFKMFATELEIVQPASASEDISEVERVMPDEQTAMQDMSRRSSRATRPPLRRYSVSSTSDFYHTKNVSQGSIRTLDGEP
ncbi:hypothetical protein CF327_g4586 [Tilletia walkeri]|nr:hypothetical protein CF327_g4586 [Tilletia walkeri]